MTWFLRAQGDGDAAAELVLANRLRLLLAVPRFGIRAASLASEHHAVIDLADLTGFAVDETEREPPEAGAT